MYTVVVFPHAKRDLLTCLRYIRETLQNPQAAAALDQENERKCRMLSEMPYTGRLVNNEQLAEYGILSVPVKNYLLFYTIDETRKQVSIVRFLYSRRDWQHIAMW